MQQTRENNALKRKADECKSNVIKIREELKRSEAVVTALSQTKTYYVEMFGQGRANGCTKEHRQNRYQVLERVRRVGQLTEHQKGQWEFLKTEWDAAQASAIGANWGQVLC